MNATHAVELTFVFGEHEVFTPQEAVLSQQAMAYWLSFVNCGDPNGCSRFTGVSRPVCLPHATEARHAHAHKADTMCLHLVTVALAGICTGKRQYHFGAGPEHHADDQLPR
jgi:hypothetical protein